MKLFENEQINTQSEENIDINMSDDEINKKYRDGEIRIVTEQARYPLNSISSLLKGGDYLLNPEYQRRHRWSNEKRSALIESLIMNVPLPPVFLYEFDYSSYEVMDGLQRLTAIESFYDDGFVLEGLQKWPELNGKTYSSLPKLVKQGIDRRYISSIILLHETAKNEDDAYKLKQMVFDRINSGGEKLTPQEKRNANYDGKLNKLCLTLSENSHLCKMWGIPSLNANSSGIHSSRSTNKLFRTMTDVELVLRFFAYRQRHKLQLKSLESYLDFYLDKGNTFPDSVLDQLSTLFKKTTELAYNLFGESAFHLYRNLRGKWFWYGRATTAVYDPLMFILSNNIQNADTLINQKEKIVNELAKMYEVETESFEGRNTNPAALIKRDELFSNFINKFL